MDDELKLSILRALKSGHTEKQILKESPISAETLKTLLVEYKSIKTQLEQMKTLQEISKDLDYPQDYLEKVRYIIETGPEKPPDANLDTEAPPPKEPEEPDEVDEEELQREKEEIEKEKKKREEKRKKEKEMEKKDNTKNIEKRMEKSGERETADVLLKDAGEIAKSLAIERQEIGKLVQESLGTIAAQYGYTNYHVFLEDLLNFWIKNQGKIREMEEEIAQKAEFISQLEEVIDSDIVQVNLMKCLKSVTTDTIKGGAVIDERFMEIMKAYKHLLITDPAIIKKLLKMQPQLQSQDNIISNITEMN